MNKMQSSYKRAFRSLFVFLCLFASLGESRSNKRDVRIETIELDGIEVDQAFRFKRVWRSDKGGPDNLGATISEPSNIPSGFFKLGFYAQPNKQHVSGFVLVAKDVSGSSLRPPVDYVEVGNTASKTISQENFAYFWQPMCANGYQAVGLFVTTSPQKPPLGLDYITCVRSDLTEPCETDAWVWGVEGINVSTLKPIKGGTEAMSYTGTFTFQQRNFPSPSLFCLKDTSRD